MSNLPPTLQPEDPIRADWHNRLRDEVGRLLSGQVSGATQAAVVAAVLAALPPEHLIRVRITAVHVPVNGGPGGVDAPPYWPSAVSYDFVGIGHPGIIGTTRKPDYGRPAREDEARIYPAANGSVHYVLRAPAADGEGGLESYFVMFAGAGKGEVVARRRCDMPAAAAQAAVMESERERLGISRTAKISTGGGVGSVPVGDPGGVGDAGGIG